MSAEYLARLALRRLVPLRSGVCSGGSSGTTPEVPVETVATPTLTPSGGSFVGSQEISMSCATVGATIRYTTNGSTPTSTTGTVYDTPITITSTTTVKARAFYTGMNDSEVASGVYSMVQSIYFGASPNPALDAFGITELAGTRSGSSPAGLYTITNPSGPELYLYLCWADSLTYQPRSGDGFVLDGLSMNGDFAGASEGYDQLENNWPFMLVTISGVAYRVYRTKYKLGAYTFNITVNV